MRLFLQAYQRNSSDQPDSLLVLVASGATLSGRQLLRFASDAPQLNVCLSLNGGQTADVAKRPSCARRRICSTANELSSACTSSAPRVKVFWAGISARLYLNHNCLQSSPEGWPRNRRGYLGVKLTQKKRASAAVLRTGRVKPSEESSHACDLAMGNSHAHRARRRHLLADAYALNEGLNCKGGVAVGRPLLAGLRTSLCLANADIGNWRAETGAQNGLPPTPGNLGLRDCTAGGYCNSR